MPIQDSYLLRNLSVHDLRTRSPSPDTRSPSPIHPREESIHTSEIVAMLPSEADPTGDFLPGFPKLLRMGGIPQNADAVYDRSVHNLSITSSTPSGWTSCLHPEGAQYFFLEDFSSRNCPPSSEGFVKRIFTDSNIMQPELLDVITSTIYTIADLIRARSIQVDANVDLVLDASYVDCNLFPVTQELKGITSESRMHIQHELQAQYWKHCQLFPKSLEMTHEHVEEFRDIVNYSLEDLIMSPTSTVPWKIEQLTHMLHLADGFSSEAYFDILPLSSYETHSGSVGSKFDGSICSLSRLMHCFVRERVYNFHGEQGVRLSSDQSIYEIEKRTKLVKFVGPLLFYAPDSHLVNLNTIFTDDLIRHRSWAEFIMRLSTEWQELTAYATFVLNANVSFLSIQSVDQGGNLVLNRSPAQIASYLSILTSIGSIILGLLLLKQTRNRDRDTPTAAALFISCHSHPSLGLEMLAILYALPYAMFIWSMSLFFVAFSFMYFQESSLATRLLVAVLLTVVAALILWCIYTGWEGSNWGWLKNLFHAENPTDVDASSAGEASSSKPVKKRWKWPSIIRKTTNDADTV
ncbi:hypothetical protein B0H13DRAFT_2312462 [Mycena leptocephala]|nr:hypothetical protein B0H13DRAFT_2312462 [Mycena leptocephala]